MGSCDGAARPRTLTFHLTGNTFAGAALVETRVGPRMPRPFVIRSIEVIPVAGVTLGQFIDVLVASDDDATDTATPTGASVFDGVAALGSLPAGDGDRGLPVATAPYDVPFAYRVESGDQVLKVVSRASAPGVSLPAVHVVLSVEEFEVLATPIRPRPPIGPGPDHPAAPRPSPLPDPEVPVVSAVPPLAPPDPSVPVPHDQAWLRWQFPTNCRTRRVVRTSAGQVSFLTGASCSPWPWQLSALPAAERERVKLALVQRAARM